MNYEEIFAARGALYHRAMQQWPQARADDFRVPLGWLQPAAGERLLDVPAGGGYMRTYLPANCVYSGHEPCASFGGHTVSGGAGLLPLPYGDAAFDCAISVAGVHHLDDKRQFYREVRRVLAPSGRMLLADVFRDSPTAGFLDEFVGRHNSTGHDGRYLDEQTLDELRAERFTITRHGTQRYAWWFDTEREMVAFCRMLFGMQDTDDITIRHAIEHYLGSRHADGQVGFNWELYCVLASAS